MQNFLLDFLQVNAIFNASDEMHYRECKGFIECVIAVFDWYLDYCAAIGTLPNYHHYELLVKYHKGLIRDDILLSRMSNETEGKRIDKPIYKEKNHFVGIEFSFERRKWLWNTNDEVEDRFWLQSKAGFINYAEPQLQDKLVYTMSEQSTDPSVDSIQDRSLQYYLEILQESSSLSLSSALDMAPLFESSFSNSEWFQRENVNTRHHVAQNTVSYDKDFKLMK